MQPPAVPVTLLCTFTTFGTDSLEWELPVKILMILLFSVYSILGCRLAHAKVYPPCPTDRPDLFCISPDMAPGSQIDVAQFYQIPVQIIQLFQTELSLQPYPITLNAEWDSPYFGAGVSLFENQFRLMILGGISRIQGLTPDAYAAIVCHELGHILAGAPYQTIAHAEWSSAEGQSDFFAANVCLPRYFKSQVSSPDANQNSKSTSQTAINARVELAGVDTMNMLYTVLREGPQPVRFKADTTKAPATLINNYPTLQCRYENFRNPGTRPACWFKLN